jgi:Ca-activated chloride channel family protein
MDWLWPNLLLLLGVIPLIVAVYILILRRRYRFAVRYSSLSLMREAVLERSRLRRHLPFILFIIAATSLVIAMGRPVAPVAVNSGGTTIMLTMDISTSMCMRDIPPNRLEVARAAALSFVEEPVIGTQTGIVAFAGFAELAQEPTTDAALLEQAIRNLSTSHGTAIGSAILRSLDAIAEVDKSVAPSEDIVTTPDAVGSRTPRGDYVPHIIVLLTDGSSNTGPPALRAAQQAAERGVRVYTIGFGTTTVALMDCWSAFREDLSAKPDSSTQPGDNAFGSGADEATLKQIAEMTGGKFYSATNAAELHTVFQELDHHITLIKNKMVEISVFFAAFGAILAATALVLSFLWHPLL